jgi:hypothetical protein
MVLLLLSLLLKTRKKTLQNVNGLENKHISHLNAYELSVICLLHLALTQGWLQVGFSFALVS